MVAKNKNDWDTHTGIYTYDVSMNARSKGHIVIKLYKVAEARTLKPRQKIVLTTTELLRFIIIVPIIRQT